MFALGQGQERQGSGLSKTMNKYTIKWRDMRPESKEVPLMTWLLVALTSAALDNGSDS